MHPYAHGSKNRIDVVLHEGGMPSKDAWPQVSLLLGGKTVSVQWKMPGKLFSELHASTQGIARDSSRFMGYSSIMQAMANTGVGEPLNSSTEPKGEDLVSVPTKETVLLTVRSTSRSTQRLFAR